MPEDVKPNIKGNTLAFLVEQAHALLSDGTLKPTQLQTLSNELQHIMKHGVLASDWYPVRLYGELAALLCKTSTRATEEYLRELGLKDFERLKRSTTYRQVEYAQQVTAQRDPHEKLQDARLITSVMASVFNFSRWAPAPDPLSPKHIVIEVTQAEHVPEAFRFLTEGFQTAMNRGINPHARAVRSERPKPDHIIFRTNGPKPGEAK